MNLFWITIQEGCGTDFKSIQAKCWTKQKTIVLFQKIEFTEALFFVLFLVYE